MDLELAVWVRTKASLPSLIAPVCEIEYKISTLSFIMKAVWLRTDATLPSFISPVREIEYKSVH